MARIRCQEFRSAQGLILERAVLRQRLGEVVRSFASSPSNLSFEALNFIPQSLTHFRDSYNLQEPERRFGFF
jgi:hypothetical protein